MNHVGQPPPAVQRPGLIGPQRFEPFRRMTESRRPIAGFERIDGCDKHVSRSEVSAYQLTARITFRFADLATIRPELSEELERCVFLAIRLLPRAPWRRDKRQYADADSRLALWLADVAQIPRLHPRGHPHAGDGYRCQHGDFQPD